MRLNTIALVLAISGPTVFGQSAWLPEAGQLNVSPGFVYTTFDRFWSGGSKARNPPEGESVDQYTAYVHGEYGLGARLAADLTLGYTITDTDAFNGKSTDGLADTFLGLRYQLIEEGSFLPATAVRAGAIIAGSYDKDAPFAGDGAHGAEGSLIFGKTLGTTPIGLFGLYGDIGYRMRETPVPDDFLGGGGLFHRKGPIALTVGYRHIQALNGSDLNDPTFVDDGFPSLREVNQIVEGTITYTDGAGRDYQIVVGKNLGGRNTGDKWIVGLNLTFSFGGE